MLLKLALASLLLFLNSSLTLAALPATGVYELRTTATSGNVNGCGFSSARGGTDYTLQNAAQLTNTDGTAAGTTTFTSLGSTFTSQMVGNYLHITASTGLTVGWYEITTFTDANNVVLDRTPGTGTATTFYVGGACSLNSTLDDDLFETGIAGNIFYLKNGTFSLGETVTIAAAGATTNHIKMTGYNSTRTDAPLGSTQPKISATTTTFSFGVQWTVSNITFTGTAAPVVQSANSDKYYYNKFVNSSTTADRAALELSGGDPIEVVQCEAIAYNGAATQYGGGGNTIIINSYLHDSKYGHNHTGASAQYFMGNLVVDNYNTGYRSSNAAKITDIVRNNTFYGAENKLGVCSSWANGAIRQHIFNNIFYGCTTGLSYGSTTNSAFGDYNTFSNNTANTANWNAGPHDQTGTSPGFTSVAQITFTNGTTSGSVLTSSGADFSTVTDNVDFLYLISGTGITAGKYMITSHTATTLTVDNAPGTNATADKVGQVTTGHNFSLGTNLKGLGYPGAFPAALTTGSMYPGAVQVEESGGSSTNLLGVIQ